MREKLILTDTSEMALRNVLERAVNQSQRCRSNSQCTQAPSDILKVLNSGKDLHLTPCVRCAIQQFAEAFGDEEDRYGLVEIYEVLFGTDAETANKILGQLS